MPPDKLSGRKTEEEIAAIIDHEIAQAIDYDDTEITERRTRAIEYYFGEMRDTPSAPNRSSVTSRDTSDVIGWMLPGIIRTFTASGRIVDFEPEKPDDEEAADQASDYINHVFMTDNDGYRILYNATHDSLLQANGIVKQWWDSNPVTSVSEHTGLSELQLAELLRGEYIEVLTSDERIEDVSGETVYDVKIECTKSNGRLRYDVIEPEDFLIDKNAVTVEEARFCAHREEKTRSELIEMGFDRKKVEMLPADPTSRLEERSTAREEDRVELDDAKDDANTVIELFECYARIDVDGDGVAETVRAYYAGRQGSSEMLEWEVWDDEVPFSDIPCEPVPHRWDARSIAESTMDMQRVKTVLQRQLLDNLYAVNNPQKEVEQGSVLNPDALVRPKFGQAIWKKRGSNPIIPHETAFIGDKALLGLEYADQVLERRTGVSRSTMALDPEALQNQTATAVQKSQDAAYSKIELVARNQAELGWKKVFRKSLKLIVKHQDRPKMIRLRGKWVEMDPRHWNADMDCAVNVGLGTGSRDRDMAMLQVQLQNQFLITQSMMEYGFPQGAIEYLGKIRATMVKIGEAAGLKNADDFHPPFGEEQKAVLQQIASQPKPDPKAEEARAKIALEQEKAQADIALKRETAAQDMQTEAQKHAAQIEFEREKWAGELMMKQHQIDAEIALKERQLAAELALKERQMAAEIELKRELGMAAASQGGGTSGVHVGGNPG